MGRYYNGDIEGKFWFGVQSSEDGEYFGATPRDPGTIQYYAEDIKAASDGIATCIDELGEYLPKMDDFFKTNMSYNDQRLATALEVEETKVKDLLKWYARLELGRKIAKCIDEQGYCEFEAEL